MVNNPILNEIGCPQAYHGRQYLRSFPSRAVHMESSAVL